ncbi:hypothetical protein BDZ97DRAFT_127195 [Flammula alnicola]|nr:hypothetical protein BDZ97DRAFT_127195 [Flammula alnicola]
MERSFLGRARELEEDSEESLFPAHEEDGVLPIYASKGKFPEPPSPFLITHRPESGLFSYDPAGSRKAHEDPVDYLNWPNEGSSSHLQEKPSSSAEPMLYAPMDIHSQTEPPVFDKEFGREYLELEVYSTPLWELPDLPTDPQVQAFIYDSAIKFRDELRAERIREYQATKRRKEKKTGVLLLLRPSHGRLWTRLALSTSGLHKPSLTCFIWVNAA